MTCSFWILGFLVAISEFLVALRLHSTDNNFCWTVHVIFLFVFNSYFFLHGVVNNYCVMVEKGAQSAARGR